MPPTFCMHWLRALPQLCWQGEGGGGGVPPPVGAGGKNTIETSSEAKNPMELKPNDTPGVPPHSKPTSVAVVALEPAPGGIVKTGAQLSPGSPPALATDVQRATKIVPP